MGIKWAWRVSRVTDLRSAIPNCLLAPGFCPHPSDMSLSGNTRASRPWLSPRLLVLGLMLLPGIALAQGESQSREGRGLGRGGEGGSSRNLQGQGGLCSRLGGSPATVC